MKTRLINGCCRYAVVFLFLGLSAVHVSAVEFPLYGEAAQLYSNSVPYDLTQETYTTSELWRVPVKDDQNFIPDSYHSPIATRGDSTYVAFIDPGRRPKVAKINGGSVTETFIDPVLYQPSEFYLNNDGDPSNDLTASDYYRFRDDGHHTIAVGIDELGYIHVVGDMHNYPWIVAHDHMPLRYTGKYIMYWVSDKPYDVSSFSYLGDRHDECPQGSGFTYNIFFNDMHGRLYFGSRVQQDDAKRAAGCSRYDAAVGTWTAVGGSPSGEQNERLFFEDNAEFGTSSYSKTRPFGVFDRQNNLHISAPILNTSADLGGHVNTDICYLKSADGGTTFTKADGTPVAVPARVDYDSDPNIGQADIIANGLLGTEGSCAVDYQNNPYSCVKNNVSGNEDVLGWGGTNWVNYGPVGDGADNRLIHGPSGVMNQIPDGRNRFYRFWHPSETPHQVNLPWPLRVIDYEYLKQTGNLMAITREVNGADTELVVVKVEISNRPGMAVITSPNRAPVAVNTSVAAGINVRTDFSLVGSDIDGDLLSYTVTVGPTHGTLIGTAPNLTYVPDYNYDGTDSFIFTVNDGALGSAPGTVSVEVGAWEELNSDNMDQGWIHWVSGGADAVLSEDNAIGKRCINLQDNNGDASSVWLARSLDLTGYTEVRVEFTYLPDSMEAGEDFWLQYSDDGGSAWTTVKTYVLGTDFSDLVREWEDLVMDSASYNFTTNATFRFQCDASGTGDDIYLDEVRISARSTATPPANNAPVANADSASVAEDGSVGITLTGSDEDGDSLTYAVETAPTHGTLSGTAPNLTYTPDTNFFGADSFTFVANDGTTNSAAATVSITVNAVVGTPTLLINGLSSQPVDSVQGGATDENWTLTLGGNPLSVSSGEVATVRFKIAINSTSDALDPAWQDSVEAIKIGFIDKSASTAHGLGFELDLVGTPQVRVGYDASAGGASTFNLLSGTGSALTSGGVTGTSGDLLMLLDEGDFTFSVTNNGTRHDLALVWSDGAGSETVAAYSTTNLTSFDSIERMCVRVSDLEGTTQTVNLTVEMLAASTVPVDTDGDGLTDALEIALGTDPNDPDSGFGIDGLPLPATGKVQISWVSNTGVLYRVSESPDLFGWTVVRDWTNALTPPEDTLEFALSPSNGFFKVEANVQ